MTELARRADDLRPSAAGMGTVVLPGPLDVARADDWMVRQLPMQMLSDDFFVRFVSIFQELGSTLMEDADQVEHLVDLAVTSPAMVRWLGGWIGTENLDDAMGEDLQRRLVASAARTLVWRGTTTGLRHFLDLVSGEPSEVTEGGGVWRFGEVPDDTAWVRMKVASTGALEVAALVDLVRDEVPAHVRAILQVGEDVVWDSDQDSTW